MRARPRKNQLPSAKERTPVLGTGHHTSRSHFRCSDKLRSAPAQTAFRRHTENILSVNSRKLGSRGDLFPSPGSIPLRGSPMIPDLGPKGLPARQNSNSGHLNHTKACVKPSATVSSEKPDCFIIPLVLSLASETIGDCTDSALGRFAAGQTLLVAAAVAAMTPSRPSLGASTPSRPLLSVETTIPWPNAQ